MTSKPILLIAIPIYMLVLWGALAGSAQHDFVCFWTSAQLLRAHHNPYDSSAIWNIERSVGNVRNSPFVMRDPPLILPLIAPLGFLSLKLAAFLWSAAIIGAFAVSMRIAKIPEIAWLFGPLLVCLMAGQVTALLLAATLLFFHFSESHPRIAGLFLPLLFIKPHLFILFWPVLLFDCIRHRDFRYFYLSTPLALMLLAIASMLAPHGWSQYFAMLKTENIPTEAMPNISSILRMSLHNPWLQIIPTLLGLVWLVTYYAAHKENWNWRDHGPSLVTASVFLSPYSWYYDQSLFLPDMARVAMFRTSQKLLLLLVMTVSPFILFVFLNSLKSSAFALFSIAWIAWRLLGAQSLETRNRATP